MSAGGAKWANELVALSSVRLRSQSPHLLIARIETRIDSIPVISHPLRWVCKPVDMKRRVKVGNPPHTVAAQL
jgi:hypothetical protein